jgi:hypothetical protein
MDIISEIQKITEFINNNITYGIYKVIIKGEQEFFIRNGNSVGVITFFFNKPADKCISIIRDDIKEEFLSKLQ